MKALLIEDNKGIRELISATFQVGWPGAVMISANTGEDGISKVETESPDIVILDIGLPDMSGFEVLRQIRHFSDMPVIILTGEAVTELEELKGFESGADDYIVKPFRPIELLGRVKNALSHIRTSNNQADASPLILGNLVIDPRSRQVLVNRKPLALTPTEYNLLSYLARNAGKALTREDILSVVWGGEYEATSALKMAVSRLRRKLVEAGISLEVITAVKGMGYKFVMPV
ncbi:MAG: response regulator transcription factor [Dehalococcoidia bacterium]